MSYFCISRQTESAVQSLTKSGISNYFFFQITFVCIFQLEKLCQLNILKYIKFHQLHRHCLLVGSWVVETSVSSFLLELKTKQKFNFLASVHENSIELSDIICLKLLLPLTLNTLGNFRHQGKHLSCHCS